MASDIFSDRSFLLGFSRVFLSLPLARSTRRRGFMRLEPRDPFSSSPRPNRSVTSPSRLRVFQRNAREEGGLRIVVDR